jgi:ribosomal protein L33
MGMEYWWNDTDRGKPKYSEKTQSEYHFFHQKSHMDWPGIERVLRGERPLTSLSYLLCGRWDSHPIASKPAECRHLTLVLHCMRDPGNKYTTTRGKKKKDQRCSLKKVGFNGRQGKPKES